MPVPTLVTDLSTTLASNSPAGSDNVFPDLDNYVRAMSGFIASIRDNTGNGWVSPYLPLAGGTVTGATIFSSTVALNGALSGTGLTTYLASPPAIGGTTPAAGSFTTLAASGNVTLSGGTANGVLFLNGSKVATSGTDLVFNATGLGIGTSSPGYKLDVAAASGVVRVTSTTGTNGVYYQASNTGGGLYMGRDDSDGGSFYSGSPAYGAIFLSTGAYPMAFAIDSVERMRLDAAGNLGLGVTPSAWSSGKALQIGSTTAVLNDGSGNSYWGNNFYFNAGFKYLTTAAAVTYVQAGSEHRWNTAPSGTAGNAISFTQAMTLDASGRLLVGTTTAGVGGSGNTIFTAKGNADTYASIIASGNEQLLLASQAGITKIGAFSAHPLLLITDNTERARITSGGDLLTNCTGITGDAPNAAGGIYQQSNGNTKARVTADGGAAHQFYSPSGGTSAPVGSITANAASTSYVTSSDRRLKDNIVQAPSASDVIDAIQIVSHDWKSAPDEHVTYGVIAQDLALAAPQAVLQGDDGDTVEKPWGVDYSKLVPMLIKEIQSLRARVAALETP